MKLSQLRRQSLSSLTTMRYIACAKCGIVDTENDRMHKGYVCPSCNTPSRGGYSFFPIAATFVVDLIQSSFHAGQKIPHFLKPVANQSKVEVADFQLSVVLYFSTVTDLLLEHLLTLLADAKQVPFEITEYLMKDHRFTKSRVEKLFPLLANTTWNNAVGEVSRILSRDFMSISKFAEEVESKRNTLLHVGDRWSMPAQMPEDCINRLPDLLELFVALHNTYVQPFYLGSEREFFRYPEEA